jgi:hypothetical protein
MNFTVTWTEAAIEALADIWLAASDRQHITAAGDRLDRALSRSTRNGRIAYRPDSVRL